MVTSLGTTRIPLRVRDLFLIFSALGSTIFIAWGYLFTLSEKMSSMDMSSINVAGMVGMHTWRGDDFIRMFAMWVVMMIGMMIPTAMRAVLIFGAVVNRAARPGSPVALTYWFVTGYVFIWAIFSLGATGFQWALDQEGLLSPMMVVASPNLGAGLLIAAGLYQFTPWKNTCLRHCQSPIMFIARRYRAGRFSALRLGAHHGAYCLGCCWVLMGLLFLGGVMNLIWIAAIAGFVLLEKLLPPSLRTVPLTGSLMVVIGLGFIAIG
jgi:predicted metal-binding membrane protein